MKHSKTVELFLALGLSATLVACGSGGGSPEAGESGGSTPDKVESQQKSNEGGQSTPATKESEKKNDEGGEGGEG
ncbi:hypothetical protein [Oscillatoria sp. FACHB-1406]|uniref:hypothetical protein n=1 Tax=Oscillatoria sp. FACHB-1406 TaxID=2692846 RepID=UPI0016880C98|nr:hypothetical protein [Oscillatoria sp. FACHB-1406]MBD2578168.1 hypothetical protein [Oscillatoria sp. FACHB-1406]